MRAYAGVDYLARQFLERGYPVTVFAHVPAEHMSETVGLPYKVQSLHSGWLGALPRVRNLIFRRRIQSELERGCSAVLVNVTNPSGYFKLSVDHKLARPHVPLIHYCPEIWVPGEPTRLSKSTLAFYQAHINLPDLIIDVDAHRAVARQKAFSVQKPVHVLPNTLPRNAVSASVPEGELARLAGRSFPAGKRILLFTGAASASTLEEIRQLVPKLNDQVFFLWFVSGKKEEAMRATLAIGEAGHERFHVAPAVPREVLLAAQRQAHAGLIAYSQRAVPTLNQKFAAPTKLYEYIANGLPVVSYPNPSIVKQVVDYSIGQCAAEDSAASLAEAANALLARPDLANLSDHVERVFFDHLCYERQSAEIMERLLALVEPNSSQQRFGT